MDEFEREIYDKYQDWECPICGDMSDLDDYDSEEEEVKSVIVPPVPPRAASVDQNLRALEPVRIQTQQMPVIMNQRPPVPQNSV